MFLCIVVRLSTGEEERDVSGQICAGGRSGVLVQAGPAPAGAGVQAEGEGPEGYVAEADGTCVGLLRYGLFWDEIPFCTLLFVAQGHRGTGCGKALMSRWETDMCAEGHGLFMTSTQADEAAQHFYRRLGYRDAGCLLLDGAGYAQPTELFFTKTAGRS